MPPIATPDRNAVRTGHGVAGLWIAQQQQALPLLLRSAATVGELIPALR